jgi:hypothetical protein
VPIVRFLAPFVAASFLVALPSAHAAIVVPTFGTQGVVPAPLVERFMEAFRQQLGVRTGLSVLPSDAAPPPLTSHLTPEVAAAIAELGGGRYSVSGEILAPSGGLREGPYSVNLLVTDARTGRSSDVFSQPLDPRNVMSAVAPLTRGVGAFIAPGEAPARGTASLFVTSQPRGAEVYINGILVGETASLGPLQLAPGAYEVEVRAPGFLPQSDALTLGPEQAEFLNFTLTEIRGGSILVRSVPTADVFLDGRLMGRTPLTVEAAPGVRTLRLARPGFRSETQSVAVRSFFVTRVPEVHLEPRYSNLVFWTPLPGFDVAIDGVARPRNFAPNLRPGVHHVALTRRERAIEFTFELPHAGVFELDLQTRVLTPLGGGGGGGRQDP